MRARLAPGEARGSHEGQPVIRLVVFSLNRLAWSVPTMAGLVAIVFVISHIIPADPVALLAGESATPAQIAELRSELGYDRPLLRQLASYYTGLVRGEFGTSLFTTRPVLDDLSRRMPATIELTFAAMVVSVLLGIPLGVVSALYRNTWLDHVLRIVTVSGPCDRELLARHHVAAPVLHGHLGGRPLNGRVDGFPPRGPTGFFLVDSLVTGKIGAFRSALHHLALPVVTLAFPALATVVRFTRAGVLDVMQSGFVVYQRAMGIPSTVIAWKYILRNALISTVTQIGLLFGILLAGTVVIETVFDWPGIGQYAYISILRSDYNAVMGFTVWAGLMFIFVNYCVDVVHRFIDPRE